MTAGAQTQDLRGRDPALTYTASSAQRAGATRYAGSLARAAGETVGSYAITQGTVLGRPELRHHLRRGEPDDHGESGDGDGGGQQQDLRGRGPGADLHGERAQRRVDSYAGSLARAAGETVGSYAITQGTVSAGPNYAITFVGANLTITAQRR